MTFRLQNSKLLLTYKTHLDKAEYTDWISSLKGDVEELYIGHETGDTEYEHTHVAVKWKKAITSSKAGIFDYNGIHPNITKVKSGDADWKRVVKYVAKQDDGVVLPERYSDDYCLVDNIWKEKTLGDVFKKNITQQGDLKLASGLEKVFNAKPLGGLKRTLTEDMLYPWETELLAEIHDTVPDDRHILWYVDRKGGAGKTSFCKWAVNSWPDKYYLCQQAGAMRDFATIYRNATIGGWEGHCMFFNLTRADRKHKVYAALEAVKDGVVTSIKYSGCTTLNDSAHVIVFANWTPDVEEISMDRWVIREIKDHRAEPITLTARECPVDFSED